MAELISTKSGLVTIQTERDITDAIEDQMGSEFAHYIEEYLDAADYETALAQEKAKTDEIAVMEENSGLRDQLFEVKEMLEKWQVMLEGRINKTKLYNEMVNLEKSINSIL